MKTKIWETLVLGMASVLFLIGTAQAQRLKNGGKPIAAEIEGLQSVYCVNLTAGWRVCKGRRENEYAGKFVFQNDGKTVATLDTDIFVDSSTEDFFAFYGDLDSDKSPELVVVNHDSTSNGLGIKYYTIRIFPNPIKNGFEQFLSVPAQDFGSQCIFIFDAQAKTTFIFLVEWETFYKLDERRGGGLYPVGRFFRYRKGLLKPATDKSVLTRRYLFSFEKERWRTYDDSHIPFLWIAGGKSRASAVDPEFSENEISSQLGTIEKSEQIVEQNNDGSPVNAEQIIINLDEGGEIACIINRDNAWELPTDERKIVLPKLGLFAPRFAFPNGFDAHSVFPKLEGKRVRLTTYTDAFGNEQKKLWFLKDGVSNSSALRK